jgi:hypothetical protein
MNFLTHGEILSKNGVSEKIVRYSRKIEKKSKYVKEI